jgi:hypothetical protein
MRGLVAFVPHVPTPFREHSGNIQGTFKEHSGNIQGTFREHSENERVGCFHTCQNPRGILRFGSLSTLLSPSTLS